MQTVNLKIRLELDEGELRVDWIKDAIEECLLEDLGEKITDFRIVVPPLTMEVCPTQHDESDDIEDVKTITSYGEA
jgi:hypothetical protein